MSKTGTITLSEVAARTAVLEVACTRCPRAGRYQTAALVERHGGDYPVTLWLREVSADCPRRLDPGVSIYDLCGVHCPGLAAVFLR